MTVQVRYTATVLNGDTEETFAGWVDPSWNRYELRSTAEDVQTYVYADVAEALAAIESEIGAADHFDGAAYYAADEDMNRESGEIWMRAAHVTEI